LFQPRVFGRTGFTVHPLGVGSSYGVGAKGVEEAFERGVNYFYWAWRRSSGMRDGLRAIFRHDRDKIFLTITSLLPAEPLIRYNVHRVLKALGTDYVDGLQFFQLKNRPIKPWLQLDAAMRLQEEGKVRHIGVSSHHRPNFAAYCHEPFMEFFHVRYNARHRGAETDVFPLIPPKGDPARPGVVAFTATSWGQLLRADGSKIGALPTPTAGDCYRFALTNRHVDVVLTGPKDDAQMRHALDAIDEGPMSADELEWMRAVGDRLRR